MPGLTSTVLSLVNKKADLKHKQQQKTPAYHRTLVPGQAFPDVHLPKLGGGELSLRPSSDKPRIIVVYRGAFCPFCRVRNRGRIMRMAGRAAVLRRCACAPRSGVAVH